MKIVAITEHSNGNATVGDMWKETKVFDENDTLGDVMEWVGSRTTNVTITVPENDADEYKEKIKQSF